MVAANKPAQDHGKEQRNGRRGDGVGIEHFQKLNVRGDDADQVALVPPLQLGRTQPPQGEKHLVPDQGQQLKGDKVIASLLPVAKSRTQQGEHQHAGENRPKG